MAQKDGSGRGTYKIGYDKAQSDTNEVERTSAIVMHYTKEKRSL